MIAADDTSPRFSPPSAPFVSGGSANWGGPDIAVGSGKMTIGTTTHAEPATIWLVRYDPCTLRVPIRASRNGGRTIAHKDIVRS